MNIKLLIFGFVMIFGCSVSNNKHLSNQIVLKDFDLGYLNFMGKYDIADSTYWGGKFLLGSLN